MERKKYKSKLVEASVGRLFWASMCTALIISNVMLSMFVLNADTSEKTTYVPIGFEKSFWVHKEKVDPDNLEQMTLFFLDLYTDYHPSNVSYRFDMILEHVDPISHGLMKRVFDSEAEKIKRAGLASTFHPSKILIREKKVYVHGILQPLVAGKALEPNLDAVFFIEFNHENGRLFIKGIEQVTETQSGEYIAYE